MNVQEVLETYGPPQKSALDEEAYQTRSEKNGLRRFPTLAQAMKEAEKDESVWKVSFFTPNSHVRLIRKEGEWVNEPVMENLK